MASSVGSISSAQRVEAYTPPPVVKQQAPAAQPAKTPAPRQDTVSLSPQATAASRLSESDFERK